MSKNYQKCGKYRGNYQKSQKNKENRENQAIFKNTGKAQRKRVKKTRFLFNEQAYKPR